MGSVRRVFVEKKSDYAVAAKELRHEIRRYLGIMDVTGVRVLIRYDVENMRSLRWTSFTERNTRYQRENAAFPLNFFRGSLTRERIRQSSAYVLSKRMKIR